jgi:putative SOS response-associated peptidase YedK
VGIVNLSGTAAPLWIYPEYPPHTRADGQPIALAGLWDRWRSADKSETTETFTVVTTEPSEFAAQFHNRMPLVLEPDSWDLWMKGDPETAAALMKPANDDVLVSRPVNKAVGNVKNNGPELLHFAD